MLGLPRRCSRAALLQGLDLLESMDLRSEYAALKMPVFTLLGSNDHLVPVALAVALPARALAFVDRMPDCGHLPFVSHPLLFLGALREFARMQEAA
jgi:pimeloyl-[acyl-carrier protein] methyl ester esterase